MFAALALILVLELVTFGGVLRQTWLSVLLLWTAACGVLLLVRIARDKPLDYRFILGVLAVTALTIVTGPKYAIALFAAVWTWHAAKSSPDGVLRFFHVLILIGVLEALFGFFQHFVQPNWVFGYHNLTNRVSGSLINRNHYAGLLELLVVVPLGLAYARSSEREGARAYIYLLLTAFTAIALIFSLSRMGIGSFFMTLLILGILIRLSGGQRNLERVLGLGLVGMIVAGVMWIGVDVVVERYGQLVGPERALHDSGRIEVFSDTLKMIAANPWGIGAGKYQDVFRRYQTHSLDSLFDHAHNDYLENAAEWGVIPATAFWALIIFVLARSIYIFPSIESSIERGILLTCIGSISSLMIHGLADFNLQIPVNATLFFAFVGIAAAFPLNMSFADEDREPIYLE